MTYMVGVGGTGVSRTITFTVGLYLMDDGDVLPVRCDTYQVWRGPAAVCPA